MLFDGTHLSHFVSRQVREKCKPKTEINRQDEDASSQNDRPLRKNKSQMSLGINQSLRSLNNSIAASNNMLNDDSIVFELENSDFVDLEEYEGICVTIELLDYAELIQDLANRQTIPSQTIARSIEVYYSKVIDIMSDFGADIVKYVFCNVDFKQIVLFVYGDFSKPNMMAKIRN
jgi:hypothetical protein